MALWEYLGAGSGTTKWLYKLNGNANDSSWNWNNGTSTNVSWVAGRLWSQCAQTWTSAYIAIPNSICSAIWTWDFTISLFLYPINPWAWIYPMIFGSFQPSSPFIWPTIFYDPTNNWWWWNAIEVRLTASNKQFVTSPSASSLYQKWTNMIFTRISWVCNFYINWSNVKQWNDATNVNSTTESFILSRNYIYQQFPSWARMDDCFINVWKWMTASEARKYYTYTTWRLATI